MTNANVILALVYGTWTSIETDRQSVLLLKCFFNIETKTNIIFVYIHGLKSRQTYKVEDERLFMYEVRNYSIWNAYWTLGNHLLRRQCEDKTRVREIDTTAIVPFQPGLPHSRANSENSVHAWRAPDSMTRKKKREQTKRLKCVCSTSTRDLRVKTCMIIVPSIIRTVVIIFPFI